MSSGIQMRQVVVVGTGVAGTAAAETLRDEGYDGALTIVGDERHSPYHRPPLSKKLLTGEIHRAGIDLGHTSTSTLTCSGGHLLVDWTWRHARFTYAMATRTCRCGSTGSSSPAARFRAGGRANRFLRG